MPSSTFHQEREVWFSLDYWMLLSVWGDPYCTVATADSGGDGGGGCSTELTPDALIIVGAVPFEGDVLNNIFVYLEL